MKTISVCSLSGGQGKTTTTLLLGRALARLGLKVCLLDADPQHSLTLFCGVALEGDMPSLLELLKGQGEALDTLYPVEGYETLFIVPSDDSLDAAHEYLTQTGMGATILKRRLEALTPHFDVCLIDSPPQRSQLVLTVLGAADHLIIPAESTVKGFASAARTLDLFNAQREIGASSADLLGVLPFRDRWFGYNQAKESQLAQEAMREEVGDELVLPAILESERYKRAVASGDELPEKLSYPFEVIAERLGVAPSEEA
jgi:chromosome partitioning protein